MPQRTAELWERQRQTTRRTTLATEVTEDTENGSAVATTTTDDKTNDISHRGHREHRGRQFLGNANGTRIENTEDRAFGQRCQTSRSR